MNGSREQEPCNPSPLKSPPVGDHTELKQAGAPRIYLRGHPNSQCHQTAPATKRSLLRLPSSQLGMTGSLFWTSRGAAEQEQGMQRGSGHSDCSCGPGQCFYRQPPAAPLARQSASSVSGAWGCMSHTAVQDLTLATVMAQAHQQATSMKPSPSLQG